MMRKSPLLSRVFYAVRPLRAVKPVQKYKINYKPATCIKKEDEIGCNIEKPDTFLNKLFIKSVKIYVISYCALTCITVVVVLCGVGYIATDIFASMIRDNRTKRVYMWPDRNDP